MSDDFVTVEEAKTVTGKSRRTIFRLIARDGIDVGSQGRETLVSLAGLRRAIARTVHGRPTGSTSH